MAYFLLVSLPRGPEVAVFVAPWAEADRALATVARAGGRIVRAGGWSGVLVARSPDPDFASRLYRAGAWYVADARVLGGCITRPRPASPEGGSS